MGETETVEVRGVHGTSVSRAQGIQINGFQKSRGRFGIGVYFWSESPYAEYLAKSWWNFQNTTKNRYSKDKNKGCAVIWGRCQSLENEFLDLDNREIKNRLAELCIEKKLGYTTNSRNLAAIIVLFVSKLEEKLGITFKVIETTVATAPKEFVENYPIGALGAPSCLIVFDEACINITKVSIC